METPRRYEIFGQFDGDKFIDFMVGVFDNMGMKREGQDMELPINCSYCPFRKDCEAFEDEDATCLEFLLTKLK